MINFSGSGTLCNLREMRRVGRYLAGCTLVALLAGCASSVVRVKVPTDPGQDMAPAVQVAAIPITGVVEPGKETLAMSSTIKVTRGADIQFIGNASNPGGVQSITMTVARAGFADILGTTTQAVDSSGTALNFLAVYAPDGNPKSNIHVTVDVPVVVTATGKNFNGQATTVSATYVPTDLTISLTADPGLIGYLSPSSSTLRWSVLYGAPPIKIGLSNNVVVGLVPPIGNATVAPAATTTYVLTATDQSGHPVPPATATVSVRPTPPPPSISLVASPDNGYACLGTPQTLNWTVTNCPAGCDVTVTGQGVGYAAGFVLNLPHAPSQGSYSTTPADTINLKVTATGASAKTAQFTIVPPQYCGGSTAPNLTVFYFAVKASNPLVPQCTWIAIASDSEGHASSAVSSTYGSTYTVTLISQDDYNHQNRCP